MPLIERLKVIKWNWLSIRRFKNVLKQKLMQLFECELIVLTLRYLFISY